MDSQTMGLPDANAVIAACRGAIAQLHGGDDAVLTADDPATPEGIRVSFADPAALADALRALRALGYAARQVGAAPADPARDVLLITRWSPDALTTRATWLEATVAALLEEHHHVAPEALASYLTWIDRLRYSPLDADHHAVRHHARAPRRRAIDFARGAGVRSVTSPVPDGDRFTAAEPTRTLLARIAAADTALHRLSGIYAGTARGVIALYHHHHDTHGLPDDEAAAAALTNVADVVHACLALATTDVPIPRADGAPSPVADARAQLEAQLFGAAAEPRPSLEERLTVLRITNQVAGATYDICRFCELQVLRHDTPDDGALWVDTYGDLTCNAYRPHQPFPGASEPGPAATV